MFFELKVIIFRVLSQKALQLILTMIKICFLWTLVDYVFDREEEFKFRFCFGLDDLLNSFLSVVEFLVFLF